jgi:c(7)-type cytochrome triheme protein
MGWLKSSSSGCRRPKPSPAVLFLLPFFLAGCVQATSVKSEIARKSGLDAEGHPIAFSVLPKTGAGDIDWVKAIREGILNPKGSIDPNAPPDGPILNLDIVFNLSEAYPVPNVVFPHAPHTMWLNCNNCHPSIFIMRQGMNPVSMDRIIRGEYCGRCHGVVAFPFKDCLRCHSRPK